MNSTVRSIRTSSPARRRWRCGLRRRRRRSRPAISTAGWRFSWTRSEVPAPGAGCRYAKTAAARQCDDADRPGRENLHRLESDAEAIKTPTLFIGGADSKGTLPKVLRALAANVAGSKTAMISGARRPMFEQARKKCCEVVLESLAVIESANSARLRGLVRLAFLCKRHMSIIGDDTGPGLPAGCRSSATSAAVAGGAGRAIRGVQATISN